MQKLLSFVSQEIHKHQYGFTTYLANQNSELHELFFEQDKKVDLTSLSPALQDEISQEFFLFMQARHEQIQKKIESEKNILYAKETLYINMAKKIHTLQSLEDFIQIIHQELTQLMGPKAKNFYIAIYNPETNDYNFPYLADEYDTINTITDTNTQALDGSLTDYIRRKGEAEIISPQKEEQLIQSGEIQNLIGSPAHSRLGVPLKIINTENTKKVLAILVLQSYDPEIIYTKDDLELIKSLNLPLAAIVKMHIQQLQIRKQKNDLRALLHRHKVENKELNQISSIISHDVRGPVGTALQLLDILKTELPHETDPVGYAKTFLEPMSNLLNDSFILLENFLIKLKHIKAGEEMISLQSIDPKTILQNTVEELKHISKSKEIEIQILGEYKEKMLGDPMLLNSIYKNIINNAIKFSPPNATIRCIIEEKENTIDISIIDQGKGMTDTEIEKLLDYNKAYSTSTASVSGFGFNLSQELLARQGGTLTIESKIGEWTGITISIPKFFPHSTS